MGPVSKSGKTTLNLANASLAKGAGSRPNLPSSNIQPAESGNGNLDPPSTTLTLRSFHATPSRPGFMKRSRDDDEDTALGTQSPDSEEAGTPAAKLVDLDRDASDDESTPSLKCSMPPHKAALSFRTYEEYETHYNKAHVNRCLECGKNLPSDHLLNVHIEECHDVFAAVKRERGENTVRSAPSPLSLRTAHLLTVDDLVFLLRGEM